MEELRQAIRKQVEIYLLSESDNPFQDVESLTTILMELIEPTIFDERRAAAEAMRERCRLLVDQHRYLIGGCANTICEQINNLPLDSNGGA